jgi:hypothetical protein
MSGGAGGVIFGLIGLAAHVGVCLAHLESFVSYRGEMSDEKERRSASGRKWNHEILFK